MIVEVDKELLEKFVFCSKSILGDNLTGIYLHGSAAIAKKFAEYMLEEIKKNEC